MATKEKLSNNIAEELQQQPATEVSGQQQLQAKLSDRDWQRAFQIIKALIKGVDKMDPRRKAVKNIFLNEDTYDEARHKLRNELALWVELLESGDDRIKIIEKCSGRRARLEEVLQVNLLNIHEEIKKLEVIYRTLDSFFANAEQSKVDCVTLMNVNKEELAIHDSADTTAVRDELEKYYDRLSLKNNYSLLVIPGYLGGKASNATEARSRLDMWAQTAYRNKILLVTDFKDSLNYEMLKEELNNANLQGQDVRLANVVMTCNYLLARKKSELAGEDDDTYIPASGALAGRLTNTEDVPTIAQGVAGKKYGTLSSMKGARMDLRKSQIASVIDMGVIPMVEEEATRCSVIGIQQ